MRAKRNSHPGKYGGIMTIVRVVTHRKIYTEEPHVPTVGGPGREDDHQKKGSCGCFGFVLVVNEFLRLPD